jgi:hypothetical protein
LSPPWTTVWNVAFSLRWASDCILCELAPGWRLFPDFVVAPPLDDDMEPSHGMYLSKGRSVAMEPAIRPRPDSVMDQIAMCAMLRR